MASQFHDPPAIEPYAADLVGAERGLELGKKSGLDSIRIKLSELGIERPEDDWPALLAAVKELGAREWERQRALSRTTRPQRDMKRAFGPKPPRLKPPRP